MPQSEALKDYIEILVIDIFGPSHDRMRHLSSWNGACPYVLQVFQIRNDSRSGGTVGPELSSKMGRSIDVGLPQLSMHKLVFGPRLGR
jgi:hypothetical protein